MAEEPNEHTPLIRQDEQTDALKQSSSTPIPWLQVALLTHARMLDLWYYFGVLPYIGEMLVSVGVQEDEIGFYAGLVEASFSLAECIFILFFWTSLAERIGRKPVMLICLFGISTSAVLYGLSWNVWWMIASRAMAGCFSGCSGMSRIMLGEITDNSNRAKAYSVSSAVINIATLVGPVVGSGLARPADRYQFCAGWVIFQKSPYLLPSLATGLFGYLAFLSNALFLKETRRPKSQSSEESREMSTFEVLQFPAVRTVLLLTTAFMIMEFSWTAMIPVYTYTSVHLGGLGWDITWISYIFTTLAGVQVFTNLFAFPPFLRACGVRGGLIVMGCTLTGVFATAPLSNLALRAAQTKIAYTAVAITGLFGVLTNMFWGTYALAINDASPSPKAFARINSLSQVCSTAVRAIGPPIASSLFSVGVKGQILQGQLAWVTLALCAIVWVACMRFYPADLKEPGDISAADEPNERPEGQS